MSRHLSGDEIAALLSGATPSRKLIRRLMGHLLRTCPGCRAEEESHRRARAPVTDVGQVVERTLRIMPDRLSRLRRMGAVAAAELDHLLALPAEKRRRKVSRALSRFRNPVLVDLLLEESRRRVTADPFEALHLAELAHDVALRVGEHEMGRPWALTCLARASAYRANALRATGEIQQAEQILDFALRSFALEGTGDPLVAAELAELLAVQRREQRRFAQAEECLEAAQATYAELGEPLLVARVLVMKGVVRFEAGEPLAALAPLEEALASFDPEVDPRLHLSAQHNVVYYLQEAGLFKEARHRLEQIAPLYEQFPDPWTRLRRRWLAGNIARGLGDRRQAEAELTAAREGFTAAGLGFDAALVGLDLALLYTEEGRTAPVRRLAEEMVPVFMAQEIHREAAAAFLLFQQAARQEAATTRMISELIAALRQVRRRPPERPS